MERISFALDRLPDRKEGLTLALGNFDGFHLGHQSIAKEARLNAIGPSGILYFALPYKNERVLSDLEDKIRFSYQEGLDYAYCLDNDASFYGLGASSFIDLLGKLGVKKVVCGPDFRFGQGREGDVSTLRKSFLVEVVPFLKDNEGEKISSHKIKRLIEEGEMEEASFRLGRSYETKGVVEHGLENGRKIGFPTLNLSPLAPYVLPKRGVYAGIVYLSGVPFRAMINVGKNPTIGAREGMIEEAHLFSYAGDAYGKRAYFQYLSYIREERKFASLEELKNQLKEDKERVLSFFESPR